MITYVGNRKDIFLVLPLKHLRKSELPWLQLTVRIVSGGKSIYTQAKLADDWVFPKLLAI